MEGLDWMVWAIALTAFTILCVSPFIGVITAYKLGGDGVDMVCASFLTTILGFIVSITFVLWASQFV